MTLKNNYKPIGKTTPPIPSPYSQNPESSSSFKQNFQPVARGGQTAPAPLIRQPLNQNSRSKA